MPHQDDDIPDPEEFAAHADLHRDAWEQTIADARELAAEREDEGWETVLIPAENTATEPPGVGETDRYGLVHVIPDNYAEDFQSFFDRGNYSAFDVYRAEVSGRVFLVTELLAPDEELAIIIFANYVLRDAQELIKTVLDSETMYTHVRAYAGEHLGSFEHEEYEKFFPESALLGHE